MDLGLRGRTAFVTGGGTGIGAAIAGALAAEGCTVWIADRDGPAAERTAADLGVRGGQARAVAVDVCDAAAVGDALSHAVRHDGRLDILVCNAGVLKTGPFLESSAEDWEEVARVNLTGVLNCVRAATPGMVAQKSGRIVNVASVSAMRGGGSIGNVLYGVSKAGVVALTQGLARELGKHGITVNAVAPAVADTPMTRAKLSPEVRRGIEARIPLGRLATPEDIANAVAFLASDCASFVSGAVLPVDGGLLTT